MRRTLNVKKEDPKQLFIGCGDLHAQMSTPRYRSDNYWETWKRKMRWVINYANERGATLLVAGDIFDTSRVKPEVTNEVLAIFQEAYSVPFVVPGQHDLLYHTDLEKCPLYTLALAGAVILLNGKERSFIQTGDYFDISGAGFEQPISEEPAHILITHTCITESTPPFFLEDAIPAKKFMRMNPQFKIIISGDYHVPFMKKLGDQILINTGTLMRNKKDMHGYIPYIWEIETNQQGTEVKQVEVPHKPYEEVFDITAMEYDEEHGIVIDTEKLKELINTGVKNDDIQSIVLTLYQQLKDDGIKVNKKLMKEVLELCK